MSRTPTRRATPAAAASPDAATLPGAAAMAHELAALWKRHAHHDDEEGRLRKAGDDTAAARHAASGRALADRASALHDFATTGQPATATDAVAQLSLLCVSLTWEAESAGGERGAALLRLLDRTLPALAHLARGTGFDLAGCMAAHLRADQKAFLAGEVPE